MKVTVVFILAALVAFVSAAPAPGVIGPIDENLLIADVGVEVGLGDS